MKKNEFILPFHQKLNLLYLKHFKSCFYFFFCGKVCLYEVIVMEANKFKLFFMSSPRKITTWQYYIGLPSF